MEQDIIEQGAVEQDTMEKDAASSLNKKQNIIQFFKFTLFSASAGLIQAVSFVLMNELGHFPYWPAYLIALVLSVVYNFTINRRFTFKSATNYPRAMMKVLGYYLIFTPLSTWWGDRLTTIGWNEYVVLAGTMIINFVTEFLFCRLVVYRHSINTLDKAAKAEDVSEPLDLEDQE